MNSNTFLERTIRIGVMMFAVAEFDAIWVSPDAIIHTTTKNAASGIFKFSS